MPRLSRPSVLLAAALALTAMLVLTACTGARPDKHRAVATVPGSLLAYEVTAGSQTYPFVVSVRQNDADGIAFGYDLGDGTQTGSVMMNAAAMQSATAMQNQFGDGNYDLGDKTSVWLARGPFARLKSGDTVSLDLGRGAQDFAGTCGETFILGTTAGIPFTVPVCRFTADGASLVVADSPVQPLILEMDTGQFTVEIRTARMAD